MVRSFRPTSRLRAWLGRLFDEDRAVARIALIFAATQLLTLTWDLPGTHGWENDGVAPRDLFGGLANNLLPGHTHRYPLLHYLLLGALSLPLLAGAAFAGPLTAEGLRERVLSVIVMSGISLIAKVVATAMAVVALVVLARIVRRTAGERAGRFAALFAATNLTFAFYGRVSNLDVPYLFWTVLALDRLLDVAETQHRGAHFAFGALVAASVATKDQAYATYVLVLPLYLFVSLRGAAGDARRQRLLLLAQVALATLTVYGFASGALLNPTGFVKRVAELRGSSSQDWRLYAADSAGLLANVRAVIGRQPSDFWPLPLLLLGYAGLVVSFLRRSSKRQPLHFLRHLPLLAGLSNLVFFGLVVGRSEHRFLLPFGFFLSAYGGMACDALLGRYSTDRARAVLSGVLGLGFGWGALQSLAVHLTQLGDARREVSRFLDQLPPGSVVETYGLTVYQPHFDVTKTSHYRVRRVGPDRPGSRNPLVGVEEIQGAIGDIEARHPDAVVLSGGFANAYLNGGRTSAVVRARRADEATASLVNRAVADKLQGYRQVLVARATLPSWATALGLRPVRIQSTTGSTLWVLTRDAGHVSESSAGPLSPPPALH